MIGMTVAEDRAWVRRQLLFLLAAAAVLLGVFETTRIDVVLAAPFYDPALHDFPLRTHWFFSAVMHHGLKMSSYALGVIAVGLCLYALKFPVSWLPRRNALTAAIGMLMIPVGISALKLVTNRHCPWDVVDFGGFAPYVGLLSGNPEGIKPGACFPAGHAGAGFAWLIWGVVLMAYRPRWARLVLIVALTLGTLMGLSRMAQGAHFVSHTLWSAWFAWAQAVILAFVLRAELTPRQPEASALPMISATSDDSPVVAATLSSAERIDA